MVKILGVDLYNIRKFEHLHLDFEGKSVAFIGDTGAGKSTVQDIIRSHCGIIDYPKDALKVGEKEGKSEVHLQDFVTGKKYTSRRRFSKGKIIRYEMVNSDDQSELKWEQEIKLLFNGVDPKVYYFDYAKFFFESKTPDARFSYAMKCVLGDIYDKNEKDIKKLELERGAFGKEEKKLLARLHDSEITAENYDILAKQYQEPKTLDEARIERDKILDKRPKIQELIEELNSLKEANAKYLNDQTTLEYLKKDRLPQLEKQLVEANDLRLFSASILPDGVFKLIDLQEAGRDHITKDSSPYAVGMINTLFQHTNALKEDFENIISHHQNIQNDVDAILKSISIFEDKLGSSFLNEALEIELSEKVDKAAETTKELEEEAQAVYDGYVKVIEAFNIARSQYLKNKVDYDELLNVHAKWIEKDDAMKAIRALNISTFKEHVISDQIEIREIVTEKKDEDNEGEMVKTVKQHLYYNGRELNFENISRGESLQIAVLFQTIHNPRFKVVFIPEAQSLGSSFDEMAKAAEENGFQWIAEFTERKQPFTMKFTEQIL